MKAICICGKTTHYRKKDPLPKFCFDCGTPLADKFCSECHHGVWFNNAEFCGSCGAKLET